MIRSEPFSRRSSPASSRTETFRRRAPHVGAGADRHTHTTAICGYTFGEVLRSMPRREEKAVRLGLEAIYLTWRLQGTCWTLVWQRLNLIELTSIFDGRYKGATLRLYGSHCVSFVSVFVFMCCTKYATLLNQRKRHNFNALNMGIRSSGRLVFHLDSRRPERYIYWQKCYSPLLNIMSGTAARRTPGQC